LARSEAQGLWVEKVTRPIAQLGLIRNQA
jgi:hypothetical protein